MKVVSKLKYLKIAPRKVRLVASLVRRKKVEEAQTILKFTVKRAAPNLLKLLNAAVADAKNNFQLDSSNLYISKITVDEGPKNKRWRARSRGIAAPIQKKTSHITIVLDEVKPSKKIKKPTESPADIQAGREIEKEIKPKFKRPEPVQVKPKEVRGLKRFFRRKSI